MGKIVVLEDSFKAHVDMRTKQFQAVKFTSTNAEMDLMGTDDVTTVIGILQDKPNINEFGRVMIMGRSEAKVDGNAAAIAPGDPLTVSDDGVYLVKSTATDDPLVAIALQTATVQGAIIDVFVRGMGMAVTVFSS